MAAHRSEMSSSSSSPLSLPNDPGPATPATSLALPPEYVIDYESIVTEDDTPVDSLLTEKQQRLLTDALYNSWHPNRPFVVMANVGLFFAIKQAPFVPDVMLSLDVCTPRDMTLKANRSYFVWEYGKPPNVVIEIVSNKVGGEDSNKLMDYAKIGISYYVIYDPLQELSDEYVRVYELSGMKYQPLAPVGAETFQLPNVRLGLTLWEGPFEAWERVWLRWIDDTGLLIPTGGEAMRLERQRADAEQQRADAEQQRADAEQQRADAEQQRADAEQQRAEAAEKLASADRQRAERMAAKLRELGIDPVALH